MLAINDNLLPAYYLYEKSTFSHIRNDNNGSWNHRHFFACSSNHSIFIVISNMSSEEL